MVDNTVKVKKTWFILSKDGKIEDHYNLRNNKEVPQVLVYAHTFRYSAQELMVV